MIAMKQVPLSEVITEALPGFACGAEDPDGVFQIRMNNILRDGNLDLSKKRRVPSEIKAISRTLLRPGDVLFNATNSPDLVGKSALVKDLPEPTVYSNHFFRLRTDDRWLNSAYLARWLSWQFGRGVFKGLVRQWVNQATVGRKELLSLSIPLPPLEDQGRITTVLDHASSLLAKRRQSVSLLNDLARSIFLEIFGDDAGGYPVVAVGDLAADRKNSIRTGPFGSQLLHGEFVESGIPVLGIDNAVNNEFRWAKRRFITEEKYQKLARYRIFPGDVIITIMGTCGRCAVVPEDIGVAINTKHLCCISLDRSKCLPEFLHSYFLMHPIARSYLERTAKGAIMAGLNMNIIKAMPVALPPLAQQERYVAVAREVQGQKLHHLRHLQELEDLFASLQARAFSGEL
jgi:type I restriction enzyme S subunit